MKRRILLLVCLLAACQSPSVETDLSCGPNKACPAEYRCDEKVGRCVLATSVVTMDGGRIDAPSLDGRADAPAADAAAGQARLTIDRDAFDFGAVVFLESGASATFTVANEGNAPASALDILIGGARAASFLVDPASSCYGAALAPGARCSVNVTFRPDVVGAVSALLDVGGMHATLTGQGLPRGQLVLDPTRADLGAVALGAAGEPATFTLQNLGGAPTGLVSVDLQGDGAAQVERVTDHCSRTSLPPMARCTLSLRLRPTAVGIHTASLVVTATPGGSQTAMLTGRGLAPAALVATPSPLDVGTVVVGSSAEATLKVANGGGVTGGQLTTRLEGADFALLGDGCDHQSLAAGGSCTITVVARPGAVGAKTGTLTLTAVAPAATVTVPIKATAVAPGALLLAPPRRDFGSTLVGAHGETETFTASNSGGVPTGKLALALAGTGRESYQILTDGCSGAPLDPGATCAMNVRFDPTEAHGRSATLTVSAEPGGAAGSSLTGEGLAPAALAGDATTLAFGTVDVSQASLVQTFTVTNHGDVPSGALATTLSGDVADFTVTDGCAGHPLAAGQSCAVGVALSPVSGGMKGLTLDVEAAPGGGVSLSAQGSGRPPSPLTVTVGGTGKGSVASTPAGVSCGADCQASFLYGAMVILTATPDASSSFTGWTGACTGTGPCLVTMTQAQDVAATFTLLSLPLAVTVNGSGSVASRPAGLACDGACSHAWDYGTVVTLTATPAPGFGFAGWSGCPEASGATCKVTLTASTQLTASFTPLPIPVTVKMVGLGSVSSTPDGFASCSLECTASFPYGSSVTLTATPAAHHHFTGWTGACAGAGLEPTCTLTLPVDPLSVGAGFLIDQVPVTVTNAGGGNVTSLLPALSCGNGGACTASFDYGQPVALYATPSPGYRFAGFSGDCTGQECLFTADQPRAVTATFVRQVILTVTAPVGGTVSGSGLSCGSGGTTCSVTLDAGSAVSLLAAPDGGYRVGGWTGCSAGGATCAIASLDAATTVTVAFPRQVQVSWSTPGGGGLAPLPAPISSCGSGCGLYDAGTPVTFTASPASGGAPGAWGGDCAATAAGATSCTLTPTSASLAASVKFRFNLTVTGSGHGTVSGGGLSVHDETKSQAFDWGAQVTLSQSPDANWQFSGWGGACSGSGACAPTVSGPTTVTAGFILPKVTLGVARPATGTVTGNGLDCGTSTSTCSVSLDAGSAVSLTARADNGYRVGSWTGCSGSGNTCTISSLTAATTVTVSFVRQVQVGWSTPGGGTVTPSPAPLESCGIACGVYDSGTDVTFTAAPDPNGSIGAWGGDCASTAAGAATCKLTTAATNLAVSVKFRFILTVTGSGQGTLSGGGLTVHNETKTQAVDWGTDVTISKTPDLYWAFGSWGGACSGTQGCTATVKSATTVTGSFAQPSYQLSVTLPTVGTVTGNGLDCGVSTATCSVTLTAGTPVALTATPKPGYRVDTWTGCTATGTGTTCKIDNLVASTNVTVSFVGQVQVTWTTPGGGKVTASPAPRSTCGNGTDCGIYDSGTEVTFTAVPDPNGTVSAWSGCTPFGATSCKLTTGTAAVDVTVKFSFVLTLVASGQGTVSVTGLSVHNGSGTRSVEWGSTVTIGQSADQFYQFNGWSGACPTTGGGCAPRITGATTVTGSFILPQYTLTVSMNYAGGYVTVNGQTCYSTCQYTLYAGTNISLTPSPGPGWIFYRWGGTYGGADQPLQFKLAQATSQTAYFYEPLVSTGVSAGGSMTVSGTFDGQNQSYTCDGNAGACAYPTYFQFDYGSTVTVSATPGAGQMISTWNGMPSGFVPTTTHSFSILNFGTGSQTVRYIFRCGVGFCPADASKPYQQNKGVGVSFIASNPG